CRFSRPDADPARPQWYVLILALSSLLPVLPCGRRGPGLRRAEVASATQAGRGGYLELVPKPSVQPTLSSAFVEYFVDPCGFWPFSTKWADKVHDKSPRTPFVGQALPRQVRLGLPLP